MHRIALLTLTLLALCVPVPALAGTFIVPFGSGSSMGLAGWSAKGDAGAICGYEGNATIFLNAGTLPAHSGCFLLFNAPADAQILAVNVHHGWTKASTATALCAYSFAAQPGDTLRRCSGGTYDDAFAASGSSWVELGIYNESASPVVLSTARANNIVYLNGGVTLSDPTAPGLSASGPTGVQTATSAQLGWSASDAESGAPSVGYAIDGGPIQILRGQACSWLCGTGASGTATVDLSGLPDGPHSLTVSAWSYADVTSTAGPFAFHVDRTDPAAPQLRVAADPAATAAGWWGHGPIALSISTSTASDVASSRLRIYAPSGAVISDETTAGALTSASIPASALTAGGSYSADVVQCDGASHCSASPPVAIRWDGAAPAVGADATAAPLGLLAARDGAHLLWPAAGPATGGSGISGGYAGLGRTPLEARADAFASSRREAGTSGVSEAVVPAAAIHGAPQICLAIRPVSGAGIAADSAGVRCAAVDEEPPAIAIAGAQRWSGSAQSVSFAATDANGASFTQVVLDGTAVAGAGGRVTVTGEGVHVLRVVARDGAGNESVAERSLGIDASAPVIGSITGDFTARELRVGVADALAGVASAELRVGGATLETRISADGRTAIARVPAGITLDGAAVAVRVLDASSPANVAERSATLPVRPRALLSGLSAASGHVTGRVVALTAARVQVWAYPKGRVPHLVGTYATHADGAFSVPVRPRRTTRFAVAVPETQQLRGLAERIAGTVHVSARIEELSVRVRGDSLVVRARFTGRGEATRLHLLVNDVLGGRWVEGCLQRGRPGVHLERTGRIWGSCRIPAGARGRAWTYRLVLAAPSSTWPWRTPSSGRVSLLLPF